jgi:hypothetical protein
MVVFMLVCLPMVWAAMYAGTTDRGDIKHTVRNPMVAGAVAFPVFLLAEFMLMPAYPPYHILPEALACFGIYSILFPVGLGTVLFCIVFRRRFILPREQLMLSCRSFLSSFLFLLACHDLVQNISRLSLVDLFIKPLVIAAFMVMVPRVVADWRARRRLLLGEIGILAAAQILAAMGMALVWTNLPVPGLLVLAPVLGAAIALAVHPLRWPNFSDGT